MFIIKKKIIVILLLFFIITNFSVIISKSIFTSLDRNNDSFIKIGKINKDIEHKELSTFLCATVGPKFTYEVDIPFPYNHKYNYLLTLKRYQHYEWANNKSKEILNIIKNNTGRIPKSNSSFAKNYNKDYFKDNYIAFDNNTDKGFSSKNSFHLFAVISNNAHLINNPKKIKLSTDKLNFEASVKFKGETTGRVWDTNYKGDIDFNHNKYYVTRAYSYEKHNNTYKEIERGNWYFFNDADLIITDLGITGDIEIDSSRWKYDDSSKKAIHFIKSEMDSTYKNQIDIKAKVIKADYNVTFTPAWNVNKKTKNSLSLGE